MFLFKKSRNLVTNSKKRGNWVTPTSKKEEKKVEKPVVKAKPAARKPKATEVVETPVVENINTEE